MPKNSLMIAADTGPPPLSGTAAAPPAGALRGARSARGAIGHEHVDVAQGGRQLADLAQAGRVAAAVGALVVLRHGVEPDASSTPAARSCSTPCADGRGSLELASGWPATPWAAMRPCRSRMAMFIVSAAFTSVSVRALVPAEPAVPSGTRPASSGTEWASA